MFAGHYERHSGSGFCPTGRAEYLMNLAPSYDRRWPALSAVSRIDVCTTGDDAAPFWPTAAEPLSYPITVTAT
jgi:hypothetical protein